MKHYEAYCFDLDGTVYRGKEPIPSAIEFIQKLQIEGKQYYFVTNNSSKTREQLQQILKSFGLEVNINSIYSSAYVTAKYIVKHFEHAKVYVIGADGIRQALMDEGVTVVSEDSLEADVIVMGIDRSITYDKIAHACKVVQNGAKLIGTNPDIQFPSEQYFFPGCGSFVELVANVSKVKPVYIGKPSGEILNFVYEEHKINKENMLMIGDNYHTDILCGINFGCDTLHVNTGVTPTREVENKEIKPTYCVQNLSLFK